MMEPTDLAYHVFGEGIPVICLPGGPIQDSIYPGELGGLSAHRQLIMMDPRAPAGPRHRKMPRPAAVTDSSTMSRLSVSTLIATSWTFSPTAQARTSRRYMSPGTQNAYASSF